MSAVGLRVILMKLKNAEFALGSAKRRLECVSSLLRMQIARMQIAKSREKMTGIGGVK